MKMATDPLRNLEDAATARAADVQALRPLMVSLSGSKVLAENCDIDHLLDAGHTIADVEKLVKSLKPLMDQGVFDDIWTMAQGSGIVLSAQSMTFPDLFYFKKWLTTPQGTQALSLVQTRRKLKKAGKEVLNQQDVALLRLFQNYEDEAKRGIDEKRIEMEKAVAVKQAEIDELKRAFSKFARRKRRSFPLVENFIPLSEAEIRNQAWDLYVAQCAAEGNVPMGRTSANLQIVGDKFKDQLNQAHKLAFAQQPDHTAALFEYGKQKILKCQESGAGKIESGFRNLLIVINPNCAATLPAPKEDGDDEVDSGREASPPPRRSEDPNAGGPSDPPPPPEAPGAGREARAPTPEEPRGGKRKQPVQHEQPETSTVPKPKKPRSSRNTNR